MKYLNALAVLILILCLVSCGEQQSTDSSSDNDSAVAESSAAVSESSTETSEEEKKQWTEVEQYGDTTTTREYLNGKDDYIVTNETFRDDGTLIEKSITHYVNKNAVSGETIRYDKDENVLHSGKTCYDETGATISYEEFEAEGNYITKRKGNFDESGAFVGDIEYTTLDGVKAADGKQSVETINGKECIVERLNIYENGEIVFLQSESNCFDLGDFYEYTELYDINGEKFYSYESVDNTYTYCIYGEDGAVITVEENTQIFTELDGDLIAEAENLIINAIGENYTVDNIVDLVNAILKRNSELYDLIFSGI